MVRPLTRALGILPVLTIIATLAGLVPLARPAALVFAAGAAILAVQMLLISRKRPT